MSTTEDRRDFDKDYLVKVVFELPKSDQHEHATESLWASPEGRGLFRLVNVPFYVFGVSYEDIVQAKPTATRACYQFEKVVRAGGHSTYRVFPFPEVPKDQAERGLAKLKDLGCTLERATDHLIAIDVPPASDIYAVYSRLEAGLESGEWEFEEGHCGHTLREELNA